MTNEGGLFSRRQFLRIGIAIGAATAVAGFGIFETLKLTSHTTSPITTMTGSRQSYEGLFVHLNANDILGNSTLAGQVQQYIQSDPTCYGASFLLPWSAVETSQGNYDFSVVENLISPWASVGKPCGLVFYGVEEDTNWNINGVPATPKYVLDSVNTIQCSITGKSGTPPIVPVYWESAYQNNYKNFIRACVKQYQGDNRIVYLRFGIGEGGESFIDSDLSTDQNCTQEWYDMACSTMTGSSCSSGTGTQVQLWQVWQPYFVGLIDFMGNLKSNLQLGVGFNDGGTFGQSGTYPAMIASEAAKYGIMIGNQGYGAQVTGSHYTKFYQLYQQYAVITPLEMQQASISTMGDPSIDPATVSDALSLGIKTMELRPDIWFMAHGQEYSQYQSAAQAALNQAALSLGYLNKNTTSS